MPAPDLAARSCVPCDGKTPPLDPVRAKDMLRQVPGWTLAAGGKKIARSWKTHDFLTALKFFGRIADVAEAQDHHPDLHLTNYRDALVELTTHAAGGLTENDFILAAKINKLEQPKLKE
jgi:4a-hydroxytetrahydrobiopterin dehydratase